MSDAKYQVLYDTGIKRLAGNDDPSSTAGVLSQRVHNIHLRPQRGYFAAYSGPNAGDVVQGYTYLIGVSDSAITPNVQFQTNSRTIFSG